MGVLSVSRFLVGLWGWYLNQQSPRVVKTYFSSPTHQTSPRQLWQIQSDSPSVPNQSVPSDMVTGQFLPFII